MSALELLKSELPQTSINMTFSSRKGSLWETCLGKALVIETVKDYAIYITSINPFTKYIFQINMKYPKLLCM